MEERIAKATEPTHMGKEQLDSKDHFEGPSSMTIGADAPSWETPFDPVYGAAHEGRDAKDNLGIGMVPDAGASAGIGFEGAYGSEWEGRDSLDNLQVGSMLPDKGASRREGYEGAYSDAHAGKDTESNIVRAKGGFTTTEEAAQREAFAAAYGEAHEGWDARES